MEGKEKLCLDPRRTHVLRKLSEAAGTGPEELLDRLLEELAMRLEGQGAGKGLVEEIRRSLDKGETISHSMDHMVYLGSGRKAK